METSGAAGDLVVETRRLRLRPLDRGDADHLLALDADPDVRRYLDIPHAPDATDVARALPRLLQRYGPGQEPAYRAAEEKESGVFLGWFHLRPVEQDAAALDLGYRLRREAWSRGYATEGALALVQRAFTMLNAERVTAHVLQANVASQRVLEKVGLRRTGSYLHRERLPAYRYALGRTVSVGSTMSYGCGAPRLIVVVRCIPG